MKTEIGKLTHEQVRQLMDAAGIYRGWIDVTEAGSVALHWQAKGA